MKTEVNFKAFLNKIAEMSYEEMIKEANTEIINSERMVKSGVGKKGKGILIKYIREVKEFLFFLNNGIKPNTVEQWNWLMYKPLVMNLVKKGAFTKMALEVFNE
jgi:hypothetical protein